MFRENSSAPVIDAFSASFDRGRTTALIGENGSGKTSLALVLSGILPRIVGGRWSGEVGMDGVALTSHGWPRHVMAAFTPAESGVELLLGTVDELIGACPCEIADLAMRLPLGDRERGTRQLSAGQRRLLSWLLVAARRPSLLIVDEAFASLDATTADKLTAGIRELPWATQMTTIVTTPSIEQLHGCDTSIVLPKTRPSTTTPDVSAIENALPRFEVPPEEQTITAWWASERKQTFRVRDLKLRVGEIIRIRGEIGSGKTTILKAIGAFPGTKGDAALTRLRKQSSAAYCGGAMYYTTAYSSLDELLRSILSEQLRIAVWELLEPKLRPATLMTDAAILSTGQRQLLSSVLVLISSRSPLICLDEPERTLDTDARAILTAVVAARLRANSCVILATHDDSMVEEMSAAAGHPVSEVWVERA